MNEENNDVQSKQPEQSEQSVTLDDLYPEFNTQETQTQQSAPQQPETQSQTSFNKVPDPVTDSEEFTRYMGNHEKELAALRQNLLKTEERLNAKEQEIITKQEEDAFNELSSEIAKEAGVDADAVAPHLLYKFVKDKSFQKIWQNRGANEPAFKKVKSILANEMKGKVKFKTDSQLEENDRALSEAINSASNNTRQTSKDDEVSKMSDAEFDRWWQSQQYG